MDNRLILNAVISQLKGQNKMPKRIDFSKVGDRFWCVVSDNQNDSLSVINQDVYTGFSFDKETAVLKALSERAERLSFIEGASSGLPGCQTERSDGFAAMPLVYKSDRTRENAFGEAVERFVWATWWDCSDYMSTTEKIDIESPVVAKSEYLQEIFKSLDLEYVLRVCPALEPGGNSQVQVLFGKIKNKGFISGGACGPSIEEEIIFFRAVDELYRHGFAYNRALEKKLVPQSFYEKRLFYFASGLGNGLVENRLLQQGARHIQLPNLEIDESINSIVNGFSVHRCYFKNQPPFVGGALDRLCL